MAMLNIGGNILKWVEAFLKQRQQRVKVESSLSDPETVISGVPQGSVLGPLLFLILMSDINKNISQAAVGSFADDTRVWQGTDNSDTPNLMQQELNKIYEWSIINNMTFNEAKFEGMAFGTGTRTSEYQTPSGQNIQSKNTIKDLGITMEKSLSFHTHIANTTAKGHRMAGWVLRTFQSSDITLMLTLLKSLVVSQMEYGCVVWTPYDQRNINLLESVQRSFTSKFSCFQTYDNNLEMPICTTNYATRLRILRIYSLQRRRERYAIIYIYKIIRKLIPNPGLHITHRSRTKYYIKPKLNLRNNSQSWIKKARENSLFFNGARIYNSLPQNLRDKEPLPGTKAQVDSFKRKLDKYLKTIPDNPGTQRNSLLPQLQ